MSLPCERDANVCVRQAAQIERRIEREIARRRARRPRLRCCRRRIARPPLPVSVPPLTSAVSDDMVTFKRLPSRSMRAFTASAAMRGSFITTVPSRSCDVAAEHRIGDGPACRDVDRSNRPRRGRGRSRAISRRCSGRRRRRRSSGRSSVSPTVPAAANVPTDPPRSKRCTARRRS